MRYPLEDTLMGTARRQPETKSASAISSSVVMCRSGNSVLPHCSWPLVKTIFPVEERASSSCALAT